MSKYVSECMNIKFFIMFWTGQVLQKAAARENMNITYFLSFGKDRTFFTQAGV